MKSREQCAHDELEQLVRDTRNFVVALRKSGVPLPWRIAVDGEELIQNVERVCGLGSALSVVTGMIKRLESPDNQ